MNKYEIMFIVKTSLENTEVNKVTDVFKGIITDRHGKIDGFKELGQKTLAYPIKKEVNGYYFVLTVTASKEAINEFDRKANLDENIIRHLIINLDKE